jgi:hypothetical protein
LKINLFATLTCVLLAACASAGGGAGDDDSTRPDSGGVQLPPDSGLPGTPDASLPGTPDASTAVSCDFAAQTGCGPGLACDLDSNNQPTCRAVNSPGTETSTCAASEDCAAGYVCIGQPSSCMKFCNSDSQCGSANDGSLCIINIIDANMANVPPGCSGTTCAKICTQACDLSTQTGCPSAFGCNLYQESAGQMRLVTSCDGTLGAGGQGATCTANTDCKKGFGCFNTGMVSKCFHYCNVTANTGCAGITGTTCTGLGTPVVFGGVEYGACA